MRVQRKRTKGYKLPKNTVCVSRPNKWGNPMKLVGDTIYIDAGYRRKVLDKWVILCEMSDIDDMLDFYFHIIRGTQFNDKDLQYWSDKFSTYDIEELRDKNLACWCPLSDRCHIDIILKRLDELK